MRIQRMLIALLVVALAMFGLGSSTAHADVIDTLVLGPTDTGPGGTCTGTTVAGGSQCNGFEFTITWDETTDLLTFNVTDVSGTQDAYFQGFSLSFFAPGDALTISNFTEPAGTDFTDNANTKFNNGNNACQGSHDGSICISNAATDGPLVPGSPGLTFSMTVTGGTNLLTNWDVLSNGSACPTGSQCGNTFALTNVGAFTSNTPTPPAAEPASLLLLGSGLLGIGSLLRRRSRRPV